MSPAQSDQEQPQKEQKKYRWYQKPQDYDAIDWETRKLGIITVALGIVTFFVATAGVVQVFITRSALIDADTTSARQIRAILSQDSQIKRQADAAETQLIFSRSTALKQDTFSRATLDSTGRQIATARETMQKQLRAYITVEFNNAADTNLGKGYATNTMTTLLQIKNVGQTPANNVRHWLHNSIRPVNENPLLPRDTMPKVGSPVDPGCALGIDAEYPYTTEQFQGILDGKLAYFVWGRVEYEDVFGIKRFCDIQFKSVTTKARVLHTLEKCDGHNDAN